MPEHDDASFEAFFTVAEPRLRRALVAAFGTTVGREAAIDALAYGWEHWERVAAMANPVGYLYRVGQSSVRTRAEGRWRSEAVVAEASWFEPALPSALADLSERERQAVVLVDGFGWTLREVAEVAGVAVSSVQSYRDRGLEKLRAALGVTEDA
ncbi:MAG: hypothetical protein KDB36_08365 [Acidimicrobiales bacterium]|nr:hypothetical protein [Acidimicrobiales bacterium]